MGLLSETLQIIILLKKFQRHYNNGIHHELPSNFFFPDIEAIRERERERSVPVLELNKAASPYTEAEAVLKRQRFHSSDDQASVCKPHTDRNYLVWKSINVH